MEPASASTGDRSTAATATVAAFFGINAAQRTIDTGRTAFALPHASEHGKLRRLIWEGFFVGRPSSAVVPLRGGKANLWQHSFRAVNALNGSLGPLALVMGVTNAVSALGDYGTDGLVDSKAGRTGVLQSVAGIAALSATTVAASRGRGAGARAVAHSAWTDPVLAAPIITSIAAVTGSLTFANEFGYLRILDRGNDEGFMESMGAATQNVFDKVEEYRSKVF